MILDLLLVQRGQAIDGSVVVDESIVDDTFLVDDTSVGGDRGLVACTNRGRGGFVIRGIILLYRLELQVSIRIQ